MRIPPALIPCSVLAGAILRNTSADQRANQTPSRAARAQTCQRGGQRPCDNQAKAGDHDRSADGKKRTEGRTDTAADRPALSHTLGSFGTAGEFSAWLGVTEVPLPRVLGHHHVDVVSLVAMVRRQATISSSGRFGRRIQRGDITLPRVALTNCCAADAVRFVHDIVVGLARASNRVVALTFTLKFAVVRDVAREVFRRALDTLPHGRDFFTDRIVALLVDVHMNLYMTALY